MIFKNGCFYLKNFYRSKHLNRSEMNGKRKNLNKNEKY